MATATYEVQASQFNIDRSHPGRWTITFNNPPINMFVPTTIVELGALIDMLSGPMFFRWLQGHAPLDKGFAKSIFDKVIPAFQTK